MRYQVKKQFTAKIDGGQKAFLPGDMIDLPEEKVKRLLLAGVLAPTEIEGMQAEYFTLLARFWEIDDDPNGTIDEARRIVARLNELYMELHRQGRQVPVRLPVERSKAA
jgi:hypothetical protein